MRTFVPTRARFVRHSASGSDVDPVAVAFLEMAVYGAPVPGGVHGPCHERDDRSCSQTSVCYEQMEVARGPGFGLKMLRGGPLGMGVDVSTAGRMAATS